MENHNAPVNVNDIFIIRWDTPKHKIDKAFQDGIKHATNHYYDEELDITVPFCMNGWNCNPYSISRPSVYYAWLSGFSEQWAKLQREESPDID